MKQKKIKICSICSERFENGRVYSNHVRWKHKVKTIKCKFCGEIFSCGIKQHEPTCLHNPKNIRYCKECCKQILNYDAKTFCNSSCSATYNNKIRVKNFKPKQSNCLMCGTSLVSVINKKQYCKSCINKRQNSYMNKTTFNCKCLICSKQFEHVGRKVKTCSFICYKKLLSQQSKANVNCGGDTNYKKYYYKDIYMDSTWELEIAKWMDGEGIEWERSRKIMFWWTDINGNKRRYYPDFYLPKYNIYLDPKNKYLLSKSLYKLEQVKKENNITLIYGDKDYVIRAVSDKR